MKDLVELRNIFLKYLTQDSETQDMRRKDFNQAIFIPSGFGAGKQVFNDTDLDMVMEKFDRAVKALKQGSKGGRDENRKNN